MVRAPMAPQLIRSAIYWGVMGSSSSVAVGRPISLILRRSWRAFLSPRSISKVPFRLGSLIRPFQPTVVRGFSK